MKQYHLFKYANGKSLAEINGSVEVPKNKGFLRTLLAYTGPGALVAVGYPDEKPSVPKKKTVEDLLSYC